MGSNFYGGRDGQPFIIKQVFSSLTEMLNSDQIDYQEYALLNYANRNHPLHGALYRKNFDINSDRKLNDFSLNNNGEWIEGEKKSAQGFYYIGSLKGSRGSAGNINIVSETQYQNELNNANNSPSVTVIENVKNGEINFVNPDVLNKITWKSFTKNDSNNDNSSEAFISFQIPYHVFNVKTESINSDQAPSASTSIDPNNQFKHTINFKIPKGVKGSSFTNLRILTSASAAVNGTVYKTDNSVYSGGYPIFAYDLIDYSTNPAGVNKTYFLGEYNVIKSMGIDSNKTFSFELMNGTKNEVSLKTISDIKIENNEFKVAYNTNPNSYETFGSTNSFDILDTVVVNEGEAIDSKLRVGGIAVVVKEV